MSSIKELRESWAMGTNTTRAAYDVLAVLERHEAVLRHLCQLVLDDALDRDASWHECYDPIKQFLKEPA